MATSQEFARAVREWAEVFMQRSMHDFVRFSRSSGLSLSQMSTLYRLYQAKVCGVSDVGGHLGVSNAAASQMVDRLVQLGFLERSEDPYDRRVRQLTLTAQGRKLVEECIAARWRWMDQLAEKLDPGEQEAIVTAFSRLTAAAQQFESTPTIETRHSVKHQLAGESQD
jgi:DNA-binding MarR family transcriptional regulator